MAGQAIVLARPKPLDQEAIFAPGSSALFQREDVLWSPHAPDDGPGQQQKVKSVAEFQAWIDKHIRFEVAETDALLFPETAAAIEAAEEEGAKILAITYEHALSPMARDSKVRTLSVTSWKCADGEQGSEDCEKARPAVVAAGVRRGEAMKVCTDKNGCKTHWAAKIRAAAKRAKDGPKSPSDGKDRWQIEQEKRGAERKKEEAKRERWKKCVPAIAEAIPSRVLEAPADRSGELAKIVIQHCKDYGKSERDYGALPQGDTAEDVVRLAALMILLDQLKDSWSGHPLLPKTARIFDVDCKAILNEVVPLPKAPRKKAIAKKTQTKAKGKSPKRKPRGKATA